MSKTLDKNSNFYIFTIVEYMGTHTPYTIPGGDRIQDAQGILVVGKSVSNTIAVLE